jgi:hypothetical protein
MLTFGALKERYQVDTAFGGRGAAPALAIALERIGWRAVRDPSPEELSGDLALLVEACVHDHRQVLDLTYAIASTLRHAGPLLDGSLPPVEAYLPAAEEVLQRYVAHDRQDGLGGSGQEVQGLLTLRDFDLE